MPALDLRASASPRPESRLLPRLRSIRRQDAHARPPRRRELHAPPPTSTLASSSATTSLHSSRQQGDIALKEHVASVSA
ncbi:hypothetical protein E2562_004373 [Oryza meyeriana var. granulata]|uniref:Uncharacterized protein n=1 Tax=Oryza meyeriana var. granulata TaxID=110450 RepID=A0A6G1CYY4_9ORYZ|nr:hypothetical protein E2562_004373 [Oryza meyeriana var. granulata]